MNSPRRTRRPHKKRGRRGRGMLGFGLLLLLLLSGSFAVGTYWASIDTPGETPGGSPDSTVGHTSAEAPDGAPESAAIPGVQPGEYPPAEEGPEIRMSPPDPDSIGPVVRKKQELPREMPDGTKAGAEKGGETPDMPLVYSVQVGAFRGVADARGLTKRLTNRGYTAYIVVTENPSGEVLHKVRIGRYRTRGAADRMAAKMRSKEGLQSFVTYR